MILRPMEKTMPQPITDGDFTLQGVSFETRENAESYRSISPNWIIRDYGVEMHTKDPPHWKQIPDKFSVWGPTKS